MDLFVSSIQHFSVGDGDGIRTTVFLKGCNLHCPWCHNPETISNKPVKLVYGNREENSGKRMTVDDIACECEEDKIFYGADGGVTISGGEPMLQAVALAPLLDRLNSKNIKCIVDTAGCVTYEMFLKLKGKVDTFFFDLKAADTEGYNKIGGNFELVVSNLKNLIKDGNRVRVRIPLIPDFNATPEYSMKMCEVLRSTGATEVDLLPFHRLGSGKYNAMDIPYLYGEYPSMQISYAEVLAKVYREYFNVNIEK